MLFEIDLLVGLFGLSLQPDGLVAISNLDIHVVIKH